MKTPCRNVAAQLCAAGFSRSIPGKRSGFTTVQMRGCVGVGVYGDAEEFASVRRALAARGWREVYVNERGQAVNVTIARGAA